MKRRAGFVLLIAPALPLGAAAALWASASETPPAASPLVRAQELFDAGRFRDAERLLVDRPSPDARLLLARCHVERQLLEDARDLLEEVAAERPDATRLLVKVCLDRGDFDRALPHIRRLAQEDPKNPDLLKLRARCESMCGDAVAALAAANHALALDPSDADSARLVAELASSVSASVSRSSSPPSSRHPSSVSRHPPSAFPDPASEIRNLESPQKGASLWIPPGPSRR